LSYVSSDGFLNRTVATETPNNFCGARGRFVEKDDFPAKWDERPRPIFAVDFNARWRVYYACPEIVRGSADRVCDVGRRNLEEFTLFSSVFVWLWTERTSTTLSQRAGACVCITSRVLATRRTPFTVCRLAELHGNSDDHLYDTYW